MKLNVNNLEGKEIADDYSRQAATRGRWGETWDIFKSNFGKIVLINILVLITFAPAVAIMVFRAMYIANLGAMYPFNCDYVIFPVAQKHCSHKEDHKNGYGQNCVEIANFYAVEFSKTLSSCL